MMITILLPACQRTKNRKHLPVLLQVLHYYLLLITITIFPRICPFAKLQNYQCCLPYYQFTLYYNVFLLSPYWRITIHNVTTLIIIINKLQLCYHITILQYYLITHITKLNAVYHIILPYYHTILPYYHPYHQTILPYYQFKIIPYYHLTILPYYHLTILSYYHIIIVSYHHITTPP
jgi:hypothetical protein